MSDGRGYRAVARDGWYTFKRSGGSAIAKVYMLQIMQSQSKVVELTVGTPYALGYMDFKDGYSVYLYIGGSPDTPAKCSLPPFTSCRQECTTVPLCPPLIVTVEVSGPGCMVLTSSKGGVCPSDNNSTCLMPCSVLITGFSPDRIVLLVLDTITVNTGESPIIFRISGRGCGNITLNTTALDLAVTVNETIPELSYMVIEADGTVTLQYADTLDFFTASVTASGTFPSPANTCASLSVYSVCARFNASEFVPPVLDIISQVYWIESDGVICTPCSGCPQVLYLVLDTPQQLGSTINFPGCPFGMAITLLTITSTSDAVSQFTDPLNFTLNIEPTPVPVVVVTCPEPYTNGGGSGTSCPGPNTSGIFKTFKIVGTDSTTVRCLLPEGLMPSFYIGTPSGQRVMVSTSYVYTSPLIVEISTSGPLAFAAIAYDAETNASIPASFTFTSTYLTTPNYTAFPLYGWVSTGLDTVVCSVIVNYSAQTTYQFQTEAVIVPESGGWWTRPITSNTSQGGLISQATSSQLVAPTGSSGIPAVPLGQFITAAGNKGIVLLGTSTASATVMEYLLCITLPMVATNTISLVQGSYLAPQWSSSSLLLTASSSIPELTQFKVSVNTNTLSVSVYEAVTGAWVASTRLGGTCTAQSVWLASTTDTMQFYALRNGTLSAQLATGGNYRVTGVSSPSSPLTYLYAGLGSHSLLLPSISIQSPCRYANGPVCFHDSDDLAYAVSESLGAWSNGVCTAPVVNLRVSVNPGDLVVIGVQRPLAPTPYFDVAFVCTVGPLVMPTFVFTSASTWGTTDSVTFQLTSGTVNRGDVLIARIDVTSPAGSIIGYMNPLRTFVPFVANITLSGLIQDPYTTSDGFFSIGTTCPATSMATRNNFGAQLPPGLIVQKTALQKTNQFCFRPVAGGGWAFYVGYPDDTVLNHMTVSEWSGVSPWVYENACSDTFLPITTIPFLNRLMTFS
jgi:hypothetical protein